jgi:hypothetical protein
VRLQINIAMMPNKMIAAHPNITIATSSGAIGGDVR